MLVEEDFDHYRCYAGNSFGGNIEGNDSEMMIMIMMIMVIMMIMEVMASSSCSSANYVRK